MPKCATGFQSTRMPGAEIDVRADTEPAAFSRCVPLDLLTNPVPAHADQRIPEAWLAQEGSLIAEPDVVVEREAANAAGHEEFWRHPESDHAARVDDIHINREDGNVQPIAANRRPYEISVDPHGAFFCRHAAEKGTVKTAVDNVAAAAGEAATAAALERRHVHVHLDAERQPCKDGINGHLPVLRSG